MTSTTRSLVQAVGFAALILVVALGAKIGLMLGWTDDPDVGRRLSMVVLGVFFVVTGNVLPKRLVPLSSRCSGARSQALTRLMGWVQVLWGFTFIGTYLLLPSGTAEVVMVAAVLAGSAVILTRIMKMRHVSRPAV